MGSVVTYDDDLNLKATELRLGLPGTGEPEMETTTSASPSSRNNKRSSSEMESSSAGKNDVPAPKAQVVGWPPVRSYRKNAIQAKKPTLEAEGKYVKVSMDGAPYLRKIDLKVYNGYCELLKGLENMFKCSIGVYSEREGYNYMGSDHAPTYEDKDGDWMLVGDVPWEMFLNSCSKLRLIKASDVKGSLGCL